MNAPRSEFSVQCSQFGNLCNLRNLWMSLGCNLLPVHPQMTQIIQMIKETGNL